MMSRLRCLLVDDSSHFLDAARNLLEQQGISVVGVASTSAEALRRSEQLRPDVALVDIGLGADSGFDIAERLDRTIAVIVISTHDRQDFADLITRSPAVGFLSKAELSADAVKELLRDRGFAPDRVSAPRGR
ncbi:response regulator [Nocardia sp. CA-107356]|uniref:response regulator n=1 Tax=Nocardia sp. CA-107356 TaxID=3239972 RepID=UPI003D8FEA5F